MRKARVLLADDHTIVAEGLKSLLEDQFDLVGTVADGGQLIEAARQLRPDVIVTDLSMPVFSGLEALRRLKAERLESRVIILTMHADARIATEAFRAGASGFILKQAAGEELITAIEDVLKGRTYLTPLLTGDVLANLTAPDTEAGVELTPRQREVLRLLADGKRMKEIATILGLSTRTSTR
jgi:DNA-binding NarL/FixJ family response regulator